jgi:hypothetical protein
VRMRDGEGEDANADEGRLVLVVVGGECGEGGSAGQGSSGDAELFKRRHGTRNGATGRTARQEERTTGRRAAVAEGTSGNTWVMKRGP